MPKLIIPVSVADDTSSGNTIVALQANESVMMLDPGFYKVAAVGQSLQFKIGANPVTNITGDYLAAGDQQIIKIPGDIGVPAPLRFIAGIDSSADGWINIVQIELFEIPASKIIGNYSIPS